MCPLTVDYSWGYTMPCKKHYSYTWTKGYGSDRLNAGGDADGRQGNTSFRYVQTFIGTPGKRLAKVISLSFTSTEL